MKIPFLSSDKCEHEHVELYAHPKATKQAQWNGGKVTLRRVKTYYYYCMDCEKRISDIGRDANGNIGKELLETITIPAEVVEEHRE